MDLPPRLYQLSSLPLISSPSHMHTEPSSLLLLLLLRHRTLQFPPFSFVRIPVLVDPSFSSHQAIVVPLFNPIGDRFLLKPIPFVSFPVVRDGRTYAHGTIEEGHIGFPQRESRFFMRGARPNARVAAGARQPRHRAHHCLAPTPLHSLSLTPSSL